MPRLEATQANRTFAVTTPLGNDVLLFHSMSANEQLGRLFQIDLDLLSEDPEIKLQDILGQSVTVHFKRPDDETRYFNGLVSQFSQAGSHGNLFVYRATLHPWFWFLTRTADCRIFQNQQVPDIIKEVFRDQGFSDFEDALSGTYREWENCVQYRETDFNFISRLMEQEGIYYYFKHEDGKHTLVLSDSISAHEAVTGYEEVPYYPQQEGERRERDHIYDWSLNQILQPGIYALNDFDFKKPKANLEVKSSIPREHEQAEFEIYDYPGEYKENSDGETYARTRIEELQAQHEEVHGQGNVAGLMAGCLFKLTNYSREDQNREYLITAANYSLGPQEYESDFAESGGAMLTCGITAIDKQQAYRAPRITPKPIVQGPQTAIVVGKSGEEIWTDQYGRVKVQFHWDRYGKEDENSSCWVRVSQNWAGKSWGGMFMPHIGHEVIISFLEGDPDQPIITGRVYNDTNMPPEGLPGNQTKSVWRDHGGNETIMEGKDGEQNIHTQQTCGNEFKMDGTSGSEKIELRDKYGNEIVMDAVEGTISIYSPSHESRLTLGKSAEIESLSNYTLSFGGDMFQEIMGKTKVEYGADVANVFMGASHKLTIGADVKENIIWKQRFVGGYKQETIIGKDSKIIGGAKSEIIKGKVFKIHKGVEYKHAQNGKKQKEKSFLQMVGDLKQVRKLEKTIVKQDKIMEAKGKIRTKAFEDWCEADTILRKSTDYKALAKADMELKAAKKMFIEAEKAELDAEKIKLKAGSDLKLQSDTCIKIG